MSIRGMRIGDTIYPVDSDGVFTVVEYDYDKVKARGPDRRGKMTHRIFDSDRLECVDQDDGLWQEMIN